MFYGADVFRAVVVDSLRNRRELESANLALATAIDEISAERDARSRFIAAATHDLGQPLQAARLFAETAEAAHDDAKRKQALEKATATITSTQAMLSHMLYHMRLEADSVQPIYESVALKELLGSLVERLQAPQTASQPTIGVRCKDIHFQSDPVLIDRAVSNLLQNALTHSGASRITLMAFAEQCHITLIVADNGLGIDEQDEDDLFADYRQGRRSAAAVRGGFGLGLASVRRVAMLLGGSAELIRRRRGAAFRLRVKDMAG